MLRSDIRTRARDYLDESVAERWSDDQLNRYYLEELRSLPSKNIYLEELWTTTTVQNQQDYSLPTGTFKVELTERNDGTASTPFWSEIKGADTYAGALYLPYLPSGTDTIRVHIRKKFSEVEDDTNVLDIPSDVSEVLVWGVVVKAYKQLIGYLRGNKSWDSVTKPGAVDLYSVQAWLRDARAEYDALVQRYAKVPKPRDIDLTG